MTGEQYSEIPDRTKARVETAFLLSEGGDLCADILDGKCGPEWRERLERFIDEKLAGKAGAEAAAA